MGGNLMNEDYVSFEVAKLLKEKGFDSHYSTLFYKNDKLEFYKEERKKYWLKVDEYAAPTLCMAQKWLRETKDIHIMIDIYASGYYAVLWKTNGTFIKTLVDKGPNDGGVWNTYEDALNAGILETLKLI